MIKCESKDQILSFFYSSLNIWKFKVTSASSKSRMATLITNNGLSASPIDDVRFLINWCGMLAHSACSACTRWCRDRIAGCLWRIYASVHFIQKNFVTITIFLIKILANAALKVSYRIANRLLAGGNKFDCVHIVLLYICFQFDFSSLSWSDFQFELTSNLLILRTSHYVLSIFCPALGAIQR